VVQQRDASGTPIGPAFKVTPWTNDIDALKTAIQTELEVNDRALTVNALKMIVYAPGSTEPAEPDLAFASSEAKKPFHFVIP